MSPPRLGFAATVRAVLWSFAGIRGRRAHEQDERHLHPVAVVVAGVVGGLVFVASLVGVVKLVLSQH